MSKKPVLFFEGVNDRALISTIRSLKRNNIPFFIVKKKDTKLSRFEHSKYRKYVIRNVFYDDIADTSKFLSSLKQILNILPGAVIFPSGESMLRAILKGKDELKDKKFILETPGYETYIKVSDKYSFQRLISKYNVKVPEIINQFPVKYEKSFVLKAKKGNLIPPILVNSQRKYDKCVKLYRNDENVFMQEFIDGPSVYYCGIYKDGSLIDDFEQINIAQQPCGKSVIKAFSTKIRTETKININRMMQDLNWTGVAMLELKMKGGEYYAIELNPRFWGPLQLSIDNGVDFPCLLYNQALGLTRNSRQNKTNKYGYIWSSGYIQGLWVKLSCKGVFQFYKNKPALGIKYKDVWLRRDTIEIFLLDFLTCLLMPLFRIRKFIDDLINILIK